MGFTLALFLVSLFTGVVGGLLGIGGGMILIPVMTLFFGFSTQDAVSISLIAVIANSLAVVALASKDGLPNIRLALLLEPFAIGFGILGGFAGSLIDSEVLKKVFAVFAGFMAILFLFQKKPQNNVDEVTEEDAPQNQRQRWVYFDRKNRTYHSYSPRRSILLGGIMSGAGFLAGLLGIGGGALVVPAFHFVGSIPMHAATATSSYMMAMSGTGGAFYYFLKGGINWQAATWVNMGVILGAILSRKLAPHIKPQNLKKLFAILLIVISFKMWFS